MRLVACPDKFRGTASARAVARAIGEAAWETGWDSTEVPLSDGGEGLLDAFGGPNRTSTVTGPDRNPVDASWRMADGVAVIEMAAASGLALVGGASENDPVTADTTGTGELVAEAASRGAHRIIVGLGGSASTDGGLGAVRAIGPPARIRGVDLVVACDVEDVFLDAAAHFAPQKGASHTQVRLLERRLERTAQLYEAEFAIDVRTIPYSGAAGGLAGGLAALGGVLVSGFDLVVEETHLDEQLVGADLVVTGEGFVDAGSYRGKVVGGVVALAAHHDVPVLVVAGDVDDDVRDRAPTRSLVEECGETASLTDTLDCVRRAVAARLTEAGRR